jgi:hypothetical protein
LVNILILRLCNYDKSPDHVESAGKFTLSIFLGNSAFGVTMEKNNLCGPAQLFSFSHYMYFLVVIFIFLSQVIVKTKQVAAEVRRLWNERPLGEKANKGQPLVV